MLPFTSSFPALQLTHYTIPYYLLADSGYTSTNFMLTPFDHRSNLSATHRAYNKRLSSARMVVEQMFGMLKSRWMLLLGRMQLKLELCTLVVMAAFILHNICIDGCTGRRC